MINTSLQVMTTWAHLKHKIATESMRYCIRVAYTVHYTQHWKHFPNFWTSIFYIRSSAVAKRLSTFFYVNMYNARRLSSWCKQHINILLPRKRSPCCPFSVVVASTFNTQRLPALFHCGKRYRSARLYLYKSDAPDTNLHLLRSWMQIYIQHTIVSCPI